MQELTISTFIGSSKEGLPIARAIEGMLDGRRVAEALIHTRLWDHRSVFGLGQSTLEALRQAIDSFTFAIMVFTPDDLAQVRRKVVKLPRDNVLFELGLFMARLGPDRSLLVSCGATKVPTDLLGLTRASIELPTGRRSFGTLRIGEARKVAEPAVDKILDAMCRALKDGPPEMTVHYISPNIDHSDYYNDFQVRLETELADLGARTSQQVTWRFHPRRDAVPYWTLEKVLSESRPEDVVVFVPKGIFGRKNKKKLKEIMSTHPGRKLILFDQPAPQDILDRPEVSFVGPDNTAVGTIAAQAMGKMLSERDLRRAMFVAIEGPGGKTRVNAFKNAVRDLYRKNVKTYKFRDDDRTNNVLPAAKVTQSLPRNQPVCLFAGNDESAIALLENLGPSTSNVCIVGCDATPAMRHKLSLKGVNNIATIDTQPAEQAKRIRDIIQERRWGQHDPVLPKEVLPKQ